MQDRLKLLWESLRTSLWVVPTLMALSAVVLSLGLTALDHSFQFEWLKRRTGYFGGGAEEARELLSTVASSTITVATFAFSVTMVALTIAANQLGPRLLRSFLRDTGNQIVLGAFVSTFLYCLLVLQTIEGRREPPFVPHLAVTFALLLAVVDIGLLIYFFHHTATSIRPNTVLSRVGQDLSKAIRGFYPEKIGRDGPPPANWSEDVPDEEVELIASPAAGYIQTVEQGRILDLAVSQDVVIELLRRPGHFVSTGETLARVHRGGSAVDDDFRCELAGLFVIGRRRTPTQDVEYAIDQLVEVAIRALSPGINDTFTATATIDWLGAALAELVDRPLPSRWRYDESGRLRIVADMTDFAGSVDAAFNQIRQSARDKPAALVRMLDALEKVARHARFPDRREVLRRHTEMIHRAALQAVPEPEDRDDVEIRYQRVLGALAASGRRESGNGCAARAHASNGRVER